MSVEEFIAEMDRNTIRSRNKEMVASFKRQADMKRLWRDDYLGREVLEDG